MRCTSCEDSGHVCENHPDRSWEGMAVGPRACGCGAGMPCSACCSPIPADGTGSIADAFTPDWQRVPR